MLPRSLQSIFLFNIKILVYPERKLERTVSSFQVSVQWFRGTH